MKVTLMVVSQTPTKSRLVRALLMLLNQTEMGCNLGYQSHHAAPLEVESLGRRLMVVYICHEHDLLQKSYDLEGWEGLAATASDPSLCPQIF